MLIVISVGFVLKKHAFSTYSVFDQMYTFAILILSSRTFLKTSIWQIKYNYFRKKFQLNLIQQNAIFASNTCFKYFQICLVCF